MRLLARVPLLHAGRQVERGAEFEAGEADAQLLLGRGQAERAPEPKLAPKAKPARKTPAASEADDGE